MNYHTLSIVVTGEVSPIRPYVPYAVYLFGLFGWVSVFPLFGEVGLTWAEFNEVAYGALPHWYLAGHAAGLVASGHLWDLHKRLAPRGARASLAAAALGTVAVWLMPAATWPLWFVLMGFGTGFGMTAWGRWYATRVAPERLGRVFAWPAAAIALLGWLFALAARLLPADIVLLATLIPLGLALWATHAIGARTAQPPVAHAPMAREEQQRLAISYGLFILFIYLVAGLSYRHLIIAPLSPFVDEMYRRIPYMVGVLAAGFLADRGGLSGLTRLGAGLLAFSFLLGAWGNVAASQHLGVALNGMAFGFLEPVTWLVLASLATPATAGRWFGWGLNLNVVTVLAGSLITLPLADLSPERLGLLAAFAIIGAVLSLFSVNDPLQQRRQTAPDEAAADVPVAAGGSGPLSLTISGQLSVADLLGAEYAGILSKRELEIGRLALLGYSTREIAAELYLSENTIKTHLRSVYRKTETSNRNDLYRRLVEPKQRQA